MGKLILICARIDKNIQTGPCNKNVSDTLRRCLQQQRVRTVFKSDTTLWYYFEQPKHALEQDKKEAIVETQLQEGYPNKTSF